MIEITIRAENGEDQEAIREVNTQAFGREEEAQLVEELRRLPEFLRELSLVAWHAERIIGHALFSRVRIQNEDGGVEALTLGPIAVLPAFQRQGVGSRLIYAGLDQGKALNYPAVVLIGHPTYYPRFGFLPASRYGLKSRYQVPDDVFMALPLRPDGLAGITGNVVYPKPFEHV
jgi:putative acetyltransferase